MTFFKKMKRALGFESPRRINWHIDEKGVLHIDHDIVVHGEITFSVKR